MKGEFTAVIESTPEGGYWAVCAEVPGANGQEETVEEAKESLRKAIILILEDRLEDIRRGLPDEAPEQIKHQNTESEITEQDWKWNRR